MVCCKWKAFKFLLHVRAVTQLTFCDAVFFTCSCRHWLLLCCPSLRTLFFYSIKSRVVLLPGNETDLKAPQRIRKPPCVLTSEVRISSDLTHLQYNLRTGSRFPCFHVSVSAYKRGNGASCCVCLQSQILINCVWMKVEAFSSRWGPVLTPNVYARLTSQQPGVISSIIFKHE